MNRHRRIVRSLIVVLVVGVSLLAGSTLHAEDTAIRTDTQRSRIEAIKSSIQNLSLAEKTALLEWLQHEIEKPMAASDNPVPLEEARRASAAIVEIENNLIRTDFHNPYAVRIDLETGVLSLDNGGVKWEGKLQDLDPAAIFVDTAVHPVTIYAHCVGDSRCVSWGAYEAGARPPEMRPRYPYFAFQIYGTGNRGYSRDEAAERLLTESLRTLILFEKHSHKVGRSR